jgi:hypothetical protein
LGDAFLAAKLSNAVFATKARQHNPDLLLRRMQLAPLSSILRIDCRATVRTPDSFNDLLGRRLRRHGFLHHLQLQLG